MFKTISEALQALINERGSAAIMEKRLVLLKEQSTAAERAHADLQAKHRALETELQEVRLRAQALENQLNALSIGRHATHVCAHCASTALRRTGTREHPVMGDVGLKEAVYACANCGGATFIELPL